MSRLIDLTGQRFGRLTVIEKAQSCSMSKNARWLCRCDCGEHVVAKATHLKDGHTRSCGCIHKEKSAEILKTATGLVEATSLAVIKRTKPNANNKCGIRGVHFNERRQKWIAQIICQGKYRHLGYFDTLEEAAKSRARAEEELFDPILERYST